MSMIGKTLGHYQITNLIGKGGMGEVYRAKDQKLGRDVAIKVLPEEFARDADRVARFQREAKLLASLNHPNIAAIYGLEESDGTKFLVLELVEGDTLADRIKAGPIPVEESLKLALQIAEALEAAHEKGIIHRDLKPANIKVTADGKVKVLDFGLAKAFAGDQADLNLSNSPTLSNAATQQGVILGTAAYMSPEQARGKSIDKRADIWAFGCVLYEMMTGRAAFSGKDVTDILAAVIRAEPEWNSLPENLHGRLREVLERCLEKDSKDRYHDVSDVRVDIQRVLADPKGVLVHPVTTVEPRTRLRTMLPWIAVTVILSIIVAGVAVWKLRPSEPRQVMRFTYELPEGQQISNYSSPFLAISRDGRQFIYSTTKGLYLRSISELAAKLIAGSEENALQPFFSPDSKWVGYFAGGQLKKIAITGGASLALCNAANFFGASWNDDDTIVYGTMGGIMRVSANGGTPELLLKAESQSLASPQILPGGKSVLFTNNTFQPPRIVVHTLEPGEHNELFAGQNARYLATGHIVYGSGNNLLAVPFDPDRLQVTGGPIPIVEGVFGSIYAVSDSGSLVYVPGTTDTAESGRTLVWVDRNGKEEPLAAPPNMYRNPKISPDGTRVAFTVGTGTSRDVWVWDLGRKTLTRLTFETRNNMMPVWTLDGKRIAFFSTGQKTGVVGAGVYWKAADGTGKEQQLSSILDRVLLPYCWSRDGKVLLGSLTADAKKFDIGMLSLEAGRSLKPLLQQDYTETQPQISPDGGWIVYTSDESRNYEVYVRSFPNVNKGLWQVSASGGDSPLWSPDGRELFCMNGDAVMAIAVTTKPGFSIVGTPQILFRGTYVNFNPIEGVPWDISPDGKRFLMIKPFGFSQSGGGGPRRINIIANWFEELKEQVPAK